MSVDTGTRLIRLTPEVLADYDAQAGDDADRYEGRHRTSEHLQTKVISMERQAAVASADPGQGTQRLSRSKLRLQWRNLKFPALNFRGRR
jgi:hypothetical protein